MLDLMMNNLEFIWYVSYVVSFSIWVIFSTYIIIKHITKIDRLEKDVAKLRERDNHKVKN